MTRTAPGGTSPSSGQPRAARARRSVDDTSSRGIATRSQRQPGGRLLRRRLLAGPVDHDQRGQAGEVLDAHPGVHRGGHVGPDDQEQLQTRAADIASRVW